MYQLLSKILKKTTDENKFVDAIKFERLHDKTQCTTKECFETG